MECDVCVGLVLFSMDVACMNMVVCVYVCLCMYVCM